MRFNKSTKIGNKGLIVPLVVFLVLIICGTAQATYLDRVYIYWTENGQSQNTIKYPSDTITINCDSGTNVSARIYKKSSAPSPITYWYNDFNNSNYEIEESTGSYYYFSSVAGPLDTLVYLGIYNDVVGDNVRVTVRWILPSEPDLTVSNTSVDGDVSPSHPFVVGERVKVSCIVWNRGQGTADSSRLGYYIGTSSSDTSDRWEYDSVSSLNEDEGSSENEYYTFTQSDVGTRYFVYKADYQDVVDEGDKEGNNKASWGPFIVRENDCPTISVTSPSSDINVTPGDNVPIQWNGTDPDSDATVTIMYDEDNDPNNANFHVIQSGLSEDGQLNWDTTGVATGTYYIYGLIDDTMCSSKSYAIGSVTIDSQGCQIREPWSTIQLNDGTEYGLFAEEKTNGFLSSFIGSAPEEGIKSFIMTYTPNDVSNLITKEDYIEKTFFNYMKPLFNRLPFPGWSYWGKEITRDNATSWVVDTGPSLWSYFWSIDETDRKKAYKNAIQDSLSLVDMPFDFRFNLISKGEESYRVDQLNSQTEEDINNMLNKIGFFDDSQAVWNLIGETPIDWDELTLVDKLKIIKKVNDLGNDIIKAVLDEKVISSSKYNQLLTRYSKACRWADKAFFGLNFSKKVARGVLLRQFLSESESAEQRLDALEKAYTYFKKNKIQTIDPQIFNAINEVRSEILNEFSVFSSILEEIFNTAISWDTLIDVTNLLNTSDNFTSGIRYLNKVNAKILSTLNYNATEINLTQTQLSRITGAISSVATIAKEWIEMGNRRHKMSAFMTLYNIVFDYHWDLQDRINIDYNNGLSIIADYSELNEIRIIQNYTIWVLLNDMLAAWNVAPEDWAKHAVDIAIGICNYKKNMGLSLIGPVYSTINDIGTELGAAFIWENALEDISDEYQAIEDGINTYLDREKYLLNIDPQNNSYEGFLIDAYNNCDYTPVEPPSEPEKPISASCLSNVEVNVNETKKIGIIIRGLDEDEIPQISISGIDSFGTVQGLFLILSPTDIAEIGEYNANLTVTTNKERTTQVSIKITVKAEQALGSLKVIISPENAVLEGALWKIVGLSGWLSSGNEITNIPANENYEIEFNEIDNWAKPNSISVFISNGEIKNLSANYTYSPNIAPEINLKQGETDIPDNTGSYDFSSLNIGSSKVVTFTIENLGNANLELSGSPVVQITGANSSDFVVDAQPNTTISESSSSTFEISFTPNGSGIREAEVIISNNDTGENPYNFEIKGTGLSSSGKLAYISNKDGENDIFVMSLDIDGTAGVAVNLTSDHSGHCSYPKWSPDGSKIVFSSKNTGTDQIWVMNADGSNKTQLADMAGYYCRGPQWSPDGSKIAFYRHLGTGTCSAYYTTQICLMDADGSNVNCIANENGHGEYSPTWSPDGSKILYDRDEGTCSNPKDLWMMNPDGTGREAFYPPLGQNNDWNYQLNKDWESHGKIMFDERTGSGWSNQKLWVINQDGTGLYEITHSGSDWIEGNSWAFGGNKIIYRASVSGDDQLWMCNADGTGNVKLTTGEEIKGGADFIAEEITVLPGDVNGSGTVGIEDAILGLQIITRMKPEGIHLGADVNGDGEIGIAEVIYVMQRLSGLR